MKKKMLLSVMVWGILIWCVGIANAGSDVDQIFKASFPDINFDSINQSPVKGIYEVTEGRRIYY